MQRSAMGQMQTGNILDTAAIRFPQQEALFCVPTGRRFTFAQVRERANRLANALITQGLRPGDCVAFLSTNRAEVVEIYFALAKAGLLGLPLNYRLAPVEIIAMLQEVDAVALICERKFASVADKARAQYPALRTCIGVGEGDAPALLDYESLLTRASAASPQIEVNEHDPYYYNLTSGTTGVPKCYQISHYNTCVGTSSFNAFRLQREDVILTAFPLYGRVGFGWVISGMTTGCRNVITNFDTAHVLQLIASEGITITNLVTTMASMLLAHPDLEKTDLTSLRALVFAGSLLPAPVREDVMARLCPNLYEYYGMQETSVLTLSTPEERARRPDSVGLPVLFAQVRVVDADGNDKPVGESGEIIGRTIGGVTAYYKNPAKSAETFRNGWIHTGDLGWFDEEGYLYISGRLKDVIVTGGQNVHAGEVEEAILDLPEVADCTVIGLPDPLWGEAVTTIVVPARGTQVQPDVVIAHCRQKLAGFKVPKRVIVQTEPLPYTLTGKVQKFLLVERYSA